MEMDEAIALLRSENDGFPESGRKKYYVLTFGCQQNEADSEKIKGLCDAMGYLPGRTPEESDLILVNTCAIREHAELKALSVIGSYKHVKEENPDLIIGVCGCMAAEPHRVEDFRKRYPYVTFTVEPGSLHKIPELILTYREKKRRIFCMGEGKEIPPIAEGLPVKREWGHRAWVSIMYGCNNFCSYCIVPYVRGRERSRQSGEILKETAELIASGVKDITLLGQNVNSYRGDCDFADLLKKIDALPGEYILRFMTSHPKDVSDKLIETLKECRHVEPHFHLPLQSGNDRVLSAMNRRYDMARYLSVAEKLRLAVPGIALTSDIIVGFPGETEAEFEDTLTALQTIRFDSVYSFIYSPRKGTPAAEREDRVPEEEKGRRFRKLLAVQADICLEKNKAFEGKTVRVLCDGLSKADKDNVYSGRTDSGKLVHFIADESDVGRFLPIRVTKAESFALFGEKAE